MVRIYFILALRSLRKRRLHTALNVIGLAAGLTAFLLVALWVEDELSYDTWIHNAGRIYRIVTSINDSNGALELAMSPSPLGEALHQIPGIEQVARVVGPGKSVVVRSGSKLFYEQDCYLADSTFLSLFSFRLLEGDPKTALASPHSVVFSESLARKYFGDQPAVGRRVTLEWYGPAMEYVVKGVMKDIPRNAHFHPALVGSLSTLGPNKLPPVWTSVTVFTYALLGPGVLPDRVNAELARMLREKMGEDLSRFWSLHLQSVEEIHLHSSRLLEAEQNGDFYSVLIFGTVGALILLVATMNFVSMTIARLAERAKEVGVRKTLGADRKYILTQFLWENGLVTAVALVVALSMMELFLPAFELLIGKTLSVSLDMLGATLATGFCIVAIGILYPAFLISGIQPGAALKKVGFQLPGGLSLRKGLLVAQFAVAIGLLGATQLVNSQLAYVRSKDLGIRVDHTLLVPMRQPELRQKYETLRAEFLHVEGVTGVSASSSPPSNMNVINSLFYQGESVLGVRTLAVDYDFLKTMGAALVSGRDFSREIQSDRAGAILVNESAAEKLAGLHLLDKKLSFDMHRLGRIENSVIGVVNNFHYRPLYYPVEPLMLYLQPSDLRFMLVRIAPQATENVLKLMQDRWNDVVPAYPFEFSFLDQDLERTYQSVTRTQKIFDIFAGLAIVIASMGLLGLATYAVERRTKEIGIRKVLGASGGGIIALLAKDIALLICIAGVVAAPLFYWFSHQWLTIFAYCITPSLWMYLGAFSAVIAVAMITIALQVGRAAGTNPVEALRYE